MAAKKARGWRSGRREGRSRMVQMTRHLVVSEGKETEPRYFEGVRAALGAANGRKVAIVVKGTGKHTLDLLDFAVEHCRYAPETFDHVWLVFDKDDFPAGCSAWWMANGPRRCIACSVWRRTMGSWVTPSRLCGTPRPR